MSSAITFLEKIYKKYPRRKYIYVTLPQWLKVESIFSHSGREHGIKCAAFYHKEKAITFSHITYKGKSLIIKQSL